MRRRILIGCLLLLTCASALAQRPRRRVVGPITEPPDLQQWIEAHATAFATAEPVDDDSDLLPLRAVVGDATVVGVGEATHGTHEFFAMKHRLFRFLAERMGFTVFSIEASLPECDDLNEFVHTGKGDAAALVANMHFWTWNVDEVVDLVLWMRAYNAAHAGGPQLSFRGFDMQFSQQAVAGVSAYLQRVDAANAGKVLQNLQCANVPYSVYQAKPLATRNQCRDAVAAAYDAIAGARTPYVAASSADEYERMLRYARVVMQFEDLAGHHMDSATRDHYMAQNAAWIVGTEHPGEKMMMWAHNYHISRIDGLTMGSDLDYELGARYVRMGFLFDSGDFNARDSVTLILQKKHVDAVDDGYEVLFRHTLQPRLILDLRHPSPAAAKELATRRYAWNIGAVFPPGRDLHDFAKEFDVAIWVRDTTASRLR